MAPKVKLNFAEFPFRSVHVTSARLCSAGALKTVYVDDSFILSLASHRQVALWAGIRGSARFFEVFAKSRSAQNLITPRSVKLPIPPRRSYGLPNQDHLAPREQQPRLRESWRSLKRQPIHKRVPFESTPSRTPRFCPVGICQICKSDQATSSDLSSPL